MDNTLEEMYLRQHTMYGVWEEDDSANELDPFEEGEQRWEAMNDR